MRQIIQNLNNGETSLIEVPLPNVKDGHLLIQSRFSVVSSGTEKMLLDFGKANWINKIRQQPEKAKQVLDKIKTDGLQPTIEAVRSKINKPIPLGYANAGIVIAVGKNVSGFQIGDRVASNGAHAEIVQVAQNLVAKIPEQVTEESAAFTVIGAIALQGIRLAAPTFGETIVVIGLGLIGQITTQLLIANGCTVIGIDPDEQKCNQASRKGVTTFCNKNEDGIANRILELTQNNGADAVLITASSKDNNIIADAANMCRKRGRVVLVGVVGLQLNRADFYEKEISFQVSCSYGPGRYDYDYEQNSLDYPIGFVRWTAKRNFEAVLYAMANGALNVAELIDQKVAISEFEKVYNSGDAALKKITLFSYPETPNLNSTIVFGATKKSTTQGSFAIIGAGSFASKIIVPQLLKSKANIETIASNNGLTASQLAKQFGIANATSDVNSIWNNKDVSTVIIATEHHTHASLCIEALAAGKNVFVEKPLAISLSELEAIKNTYESQEQILNIGFNRRFAPIAIKAKKLLGNNPAAINISMTINAGTIPQNHWLNDRQKSGGRIVGEVCHFIDLASYFADSAVQKVCANSPSNSEEDVSILLHFANGNMATINYFTNGNKGYNKERIELFSQGKTLIIENWKRLIAFGFKGFSSSSSSQDKGHAALYKLLVESSQKHSTALIPFPYIYNTSLAALAAVQSIKEHKWITL